MEQTPDAETQVREAPRTAPGKPEGWSSWKNPVASPEKWAEIRRTVEAGMSEKEASEVFGIDYETVRKRSQREEWLTEGRILAKAQALRDKAREEIDGKSPAVPMGEQRPETASQAVVSFLEGSRSRTLPKLARLAEKGVERAISANLPVENWQDAKIVADIAMKLHNVGQEGVQVNVLVGGDGGFDGPVVETEAECEQDEIDD